MPGIITVQIEQQQIRDLLARLDPKQLAQAEYQVVVRTTRWAAKQVSVETRKIINLSASRAKDVVRAKVPTKASPVGVVSIRDTMIPAVSYMTDRAVAGRMGGKGRGSITVRFRKDKPAIRFPYYFMAKVGTGGHVGIFGRAKHLPSKGPNTGKGKLGPNGFASRLAIKEVYGPSPYDLLVQDGTLTAMASRIVGQINDKMRKEAANQVYRFTGERIMMTSETVTVPTE
jgi:hypothetical protein